MNHPLSPIRHDYKPSAERKTKKKNALPWFAAGLGLPLMGIAVVLLQGRSTEVVAEDEPATVSNQNFVEIPIGDDSTETAIALEPDVTPELGAGAVDANDQELASATLVTPNIPQLFHPPLELEPEYDRLKLTIKRGDTLDRLFRRNNLNLGHLAMMMDLPDAAPYLKKLIPGDELTIQHNEDKLVSLYREISLTSAVKIDKEESGFSATLIDRPLDIQRKTVSGSIDTSLFESAIASGITDKTVMNLAGIFAWDVDFVLDIRRDDNYSILYEELYQDNEYVGDGEIVAAEFNNNGRTIQAIRYVDKDGRSDYFTPDGQSVRKAFLRAPVDFRVSSSFNPSRRHPVLKTVRPIKASGDGKVIFRGVKSGYGNVVILQHGGNITTLYAHMSKFASSVRNGTRVRQGQTIGYVGKTGLVTGVHLHYEYRLNGVHRNSRTVKLPQADPIRAEYRQEFWMNCYSTREHRSLLIRLIN
ncbi:MAG: OapA family protein [Woeseiales bacterium]